MIWGKAFLYDNLKKKHFDDKIWFVYFSAWTFGVVKIWKSHFERGNAAVVLRYFPVPGV